MTFSPLACFVLSGFRIPSARAVETASKGLRRPSWLAVNSVSVSRACGFGGNNGTFNRRERGGNGWDDDYIPPSHSGALALGSRKWRNVHITANSRYGQTNRGDTWFSQLKVTYLILAITLVVFVLQFTSGGRIVAVGAKVNSAITAGEYYRLFSPIFLHSGITHLAVNMYSLHSTGPSVESWFGKKRFIALYAMSGISGNILSFLYSPAPAVGASGAIFGLVGAMAVLLARHRSILRPESRGTLRSLAFIVLINFGIGMMPGTQIDNFGHLGGLLGGLLFSYVAGPRLTRRRTFAGTTVLVDRPLYLDVMADVRLRLRQLLGGFK